MSETTPMVSAEGVKLVPRAKEVTMWGENWTGLSARSLQLRKNAGKAKAGGLSPKHTKAVELAEKATLNALMNVHVKSKAEQEALEELDHAIAAVRTLYKHGILEERAETGAAVTPRRKFFIAVGAVRQLAGILRSHEGLHALRKTMDDEWYAKVLVKRPAKRELIETEATFCHGASSPHFDDGAPEYQTNVIDPDSSFRRVWDGTQVLFLVYVSLFVPYRVCFRDAPVPWRWDFCIDIFVDVFFAVDVCLSFVTGYVRHIDGKTEYESSKVKRHYLKSWFLVDFLSIIPINYIVIIAGAESNAESGSKTRAVRMLRFAKLLKLLRLVRMKRILDRYEALLGVLHSTSSTIVSIAKLTVAIFFVGHILSCFWFLAGEDEHAPDGTVTQAGWITLTEMRLEDNVTRFDQYLTSLYWAMTTMTTVGYGDISAQTTTEKIYIMFAMLVGGFMFGIIIGSLTNIIGTNNPLEVNKQARLAEIAGWLQVRNVPMHLRQDIYEYYRTMYNLTETGISEREILDDLPHTLAEPLIKHMFGAIMAMGCWKKLRLDTLPYWSQVEVCMSLRPVQVSAHRSYAKQNLQQEKPVFDKTIEFLQRNVMYTEERRENGTIFEEDRDDDRSIYIISEGYIDIKKKTRNYHEDGTWTWLYDKDGHVVYDEHPHVRLRAGDCFGESCLLYLDDDAEYKRNYSAVAATDVTLYMLNRVAINKLRETQPEAFEKLKPFELRRLEKMHQKAVNTLREQGVTLNEGSESMEHPSTFDDSAAAELQKYMAHAMQKLTVELKQSMKSVHDESERLAELDAKLEKLNEKFDTLTK